MAKRKTKSVSVVSRGSIVPTAPKQTIIKVAAPTRLKKAAKSARRARSAAIGGSKKFLGVTQNQLLPIAGAAGLAFIQKKGVQIPKVIGSLSVAANAGLLAWGAAKLLKSQMLDHLATGMLSVAAYNYAVGAPVSGDGVLGTAVAFDDVEGDDLEGDEE